MNKNDMNQKTLRTLLCKVVVVRSVERVQDEDVSLARVELKAFLCVDPEWLKTKEERFRFTIFSK